jgi:hypothetical protein
LQLKVLRALCTDFTALLLLLDQYLWFID